MTERPQDWHSKPRTEARSVSVPQRRRYVHGQKCLVCPARREQPLRFRFSQTYSFRLLETESAAGNVLARHDIVAKRVTPDARLEIHFSAHVLASVFRWAAGSGDEAGSVSTGSALSSASGVVVSIRTARRRHLQQPASNRGGPHSCKNGRSLVDQVYVRFQSFVHHLAGLAAAALEQHTAASFRSPSCWENRLPRSPPPRPGGHAVGVALAMMAELAKQHEPQLFVGVQPRRINSCSAESTLRNQCPPRAG